jgi:DNA-binding NarL/FixJ family response regulator
MLTLACEDVYQALKSGALTFLAKETPDDELVHTIHEVHSGGADSARNCADSPAV